MKLRIRRRAKKELLDVDDDATFFALVKAMLDLGEKPRPRGYDKVEGAGGIYRVWVGRDWRLLYSIDLPALLTAPRCDIDKALGRGETWPVDPEMIACACDQMDASTADFCRHIDEVGESLRADLRKVAVLIARYQESVDRRLDQHARRLDRLDGWISTLETRNSSLEDDRKPRRPRRRQ